MKEFTARGIKRHINATQVHSFLILFFDISNIVQWLTIFDGLETLGIVLYLKTGHCMWSLGTLGTLCGQCCCMLVL